MQALAVVRSQLLSVIAVVAATLGSAVPASAAAQLRPITIEFDTFLNPLQDPRYDFLSDTARGIVNDHDRARVMASIAVRYLSVSRDRILAGSDQLYNTAFSNNAFSATTEGMAYYDRSNAAFRAGLYTITDDHYNVAISTMGAIRNALDQDTFYGAGPFNVTEAATSATIFGYNYGERNFGYSNSGSLAKYDQFFSDPQASALPWYLDNNPSDPAFVDGGDPPNNVRTWAGSSFVNNFPFSNQKLDLYGQPDDPNTISVGAVFLSRPGDRVERQGGQLENFPDGVPFEGPAWNSGRFQARDGGTYRDPTIKLENEYGVGESLPYFDRYARIIQSFSQFTTATDDSRGGAFMRLSLIGDLNDSSGVIGMTLSSQEARNFARFVMLLDAAGINDPAQFPPQGKNGRAFNPAVPSS